MIRVGLDMAFAAKLIEDVSPHAAADGNGYVKYAAPIALEGVEEVTVQPKINTVNVDSDDTTDVISAMGGYDGNVKRDCFTPEEKAILLNEKVIDGINMVTGNDDPENFAFGFRAQLKGKKANGKYTYMWIAKVKFSQGEISAASSGVETLTPQPDTLSFKSVLRDADRLATFVKQTNDPDYYKIFFTQDTLQRLATNASPIFVNPANTLFLDTLPDTGAAGVIYIVSNVSYFWNGSEFVKNGEAAAA